ncbi:DNA replication ATP-dependent helicase/nuclease DNA2 [Megalops cyprinoides]|uniref:DNA replication ATP-dependent helicase/nuclease DNA2 n=1 Tax=Megalops cyprinoides TaxID=118141 RepID=UPI0018652E14|nr:DNA replication ATP-dependent helicase/nuclease DNA2 [Megalops cyprinoides]
MIKNKLKKKAVGNGGQRNVASFFSKNKSLGLPPQENRVHSTGFENVDVKSIILSLLGASDEENENENVPPSPGLSSVLETPNSQIRHSHLPREPLEEVSSTVSGVTCSDQLQNEGKLTTRRPLLSPRTGGSSGGLASLSAQSCAAESSPVKRVLCSPEDAQKHQAKRPKTTTVKRPCLSPARRASQLDDFLDGCLSAIGGTAAQAKQGSSSSAKDTDNKANRAGHIQFQGTGYGSLKTKALLKKKAPVLKPFLVNGVSSSTPNASLIKASNSSFRADDEGNVFTRIADLKVDAGLPSPTDHARWNEQALTHIALGHQGCDKRVKRSSGTEVDGQQYKFSNKGSVVDMCASKGGCGDTGGNGGVCSKGDMGTVEDCWFDDNMELSLSKPEEKTSKNIPAHILLSTGLFNRYWVLDVQEISGPRGVSEKHLTVTASKTANPTEVVILKDGWESAAVAVGSVVHLEGECVSGVWTIDRTFGFLVLLPDMLISGTSIANSIRCMRRAVLGEKFKAFDGGSKQMLNGTIVHEIFQKAALCRDFSLERLEQFAMQALHGPKYLGEMYSLGLTQADMRQEIQEYLPSVSDWANSYLSGSLQAGKKQMALTLPSEGSIRKQDTACSVTVTDFVDIEENIWSPRFGLKGKIDLTAGVRLHRRGQLPQERVVPLELKTGKESNSIEHRSQVILYTLMSLERRSDPEAGFLLYLKTGNMHPVVANHIDRRELLKLRNTLVHHVVNSVVRGEEGTPRLAPLPAVTVDQQACKYCPQKRNCSLYSRAVESEGSDDLPAQGQPPFLAQESQHLRERHLKYFSHWVLLCALEASTMEKKGGRQNIWLLSTEEREQNGGCIGNLRWTGLVKALSDNLYVHHFECWGREKIEMSLVMGDRVVVSDQELKLIAVAAGYISEVTNTGVTCTLDRNLSKYSHETLFRLDQDEGVGGMDTHLGNLSKLMENSVASEKLRELIVDFRPPQFIHCLSDVLPRGAKDTVANILKGLNKPQKQAMKKVLLSRDYTLIVGMPGTGKTTTICTLVRILHACGFSVLVTSYTHSAVDNILLKLKRFKIGFLRLGRAQKVHPDILPFTEEQQRRSRNLCTLPELEQLYSSQLVVATTCMGVKHPIFSWRRFDFCIVDEASQINQPVCLGPLFYAERFVLVGDHQQLPPIVQNPEARAMGMDESLFKRLEHHSNAVVQLNVQYRMNSKIMSLSNTLVYGGKLECGSEQIASAALQLPTRGAVEQELELYLSQAEYSDWIRAALEPQNAVCFLDTAQVPAPETVEKGGISNYTEAALVHYIVSLLLKAGCKAGNIGVIAPYRQQLKAIWSLFKSPAFNAVEVNTVDKYQGRDKSVIIVSFVRSSEEGDLGELLKDWRRLNVAITRAKHKLLMLGSIPTMRRYAPLERLLAHLEQECMIFQLPPGAHEALPN